MRVIWNSERSSTSQIPSSSASAVRSCAVARQFFDPCTVRAGVTRCPPMGSAAAPRTAQPTRAGESRRQFSPSGPSPPPDQIAFGSLFNVHCPLSTINYPLLSKRALSQNQPRLRLLAHRAAAVLLILRIYEFPGCDATFTLLETRHFRGSSWRAQSKPRSANPGAFAAAIHSQTPLSAEFPAFAWHLLAPSGTSKGIDDMPLVRADRH